MIEMLQLFFFGMLAVTVLVATCAMLINFSRIRAVQTATVQLLEALAEAQRVSDQLRSFDIQALNERLAALENE